ncbi:MAG: hypothetical protein J6L01_00115 [Alistipes sp.]|nr:hypothetical protein [Alistipes sp.]
MIRYKFFIVFMIALMCGAATSAQEVVSRIAGLEENKAYMDLLRSDNELRVKTDSLLAVIRSVRSQIGENVESRDSLAMASSDSLMVMLTDASNAVYSMRLQKIKLIDQINVIEQEFVLSSMGNISGAQAAQNTGSIFTNAYLSKSLDPDDYKLLLELQAKEAQVNEYANLYVLNYNKVRDLADKYLLARDEASAESVYGELEAVMDENFVLERQMAKVWTEIYDHKCYVYSYFLEKENREDILELTENMMMEAREEKLSSIDNCVSEPLADYRLQKPVVLNYETYIAKLLNVTSSIDSLTNASRSVRQIDYRLPKIDVARRSFVDYQAIEFTPRSPYNNSNPIPECVVYEYGTIYRILLGTYKYKQAVSIFRNASPLCIETLEDGRFSYYAGGFKSRAEAEAAVEAMKKKGFRNPQIVEWCDGQKTNLSELGDGAAITYRIVIKGGELDDTVHEIIETMAADCQISKSAEDTFVVGMFASRAMADRVAQAVQKCDENLNVTVDEIRPEPAEEEEE